MFLKETANVAHGEEEADLGLRSWFSAELPSSDASAQLRSAELASRCWRSDHTQPFEVQK